jgi:hypothetical protein
MKFAAFDHQALNKLQQIDVMVRWNAFWRRSDVLPIFWSGCAPPRLVAELDEIQHQPIECLLESNSQILLVVNEEIIDRNLRGNFYPRRAGSVQSEMLADAKPSRQQSILKLVSPRFSVLPQNDTLKLVGWGIWYAKFPKQHNPDLSLFLQNQWYTILTALKNSRLSKYSVPKKPKPRTGLH